MRLHPAALAAVLALLLSPRTGSAAPGEFLPVGDPLEAELRVLETMSHDARTGRPPAIHLSTRPLRRTDAMTPAWQPDSLDPARRISVERLRRGLARDLLVGEARGPWATPRLFERGDATGGRLELSAGLAGGGALERRALPRFSSGTGIHVLATVLFGGWTLHSNTVVGQIDSSRAFADPIVPGTDLVAHTEETYASYAGERWSAQLGRSRWAWGPGEEGSLMLSAGGPPLTGLAVSADLPALDLHAVALSATLAPASGEQLAAHRVEWQPAESFRMGLAEAVRYRSSGWRPLYLMGVLPYVWVQRLEVSDQPDSAGTLRNNVLLGLDAAWRVADGTRLYAEVLVDDLHARTGAFPNKLAYQLGWDGVGSVGRSRLTWNGELTRVSRYVYTSFFGRSYEVNGRPLGFLTGPDARRVRVRITWDPGADWQVWMRAARTDQGANGLDEPFVPGAGKPVGRTFEFDSPINRTRDADVGVRWWPATGVDLTLSAGWTRVEGGGAERDVARASLEVRLIR